MEPGRNEPLAPDGSDLPAATDTELPAPSTVRLRSLDRQTRVLRIRRWIALGGFPLVLLTQGFVWLQLLTSGRFTPRLVVSALILAAVTIAVFGGVWRILETEEGELEAARRHLLGEDD
ncbi:MAG: hypothetical protein R3E98_20915 [Gemmatimonadota bacterium]